MPEPGDTKKAYCSTCDRETLWKYVIIQRPDGVFGIENFFAPERNQIWFWRCCRCTDGWGNTLKEFKKKEK
jgi:hypothetical protein